VAQILYAVTALADNFAEVLRTDAILELPVRT
jgi:hypothetical protein